MWSSLEDSPMTLVSSWLTSPQNSKGNEGDEWERGRKNRQFVANKSPYLRNGARYEQIPNILARFEPLALVSAKRKRPVMLKVCRKCAMLTGGSWLELFNLLKLFDPSEFWAANFSLKIVTPSLSGDCPIRTRTHVPTMGSNAPTGLGDDANHGLREVGLAETRREVQKPTKVPNILRILIGSRDYYFRSRQNLTLVLYIVNIECLSIRY